MPSRSLQPVPAGRLACFAGGLGLLAVAVSPPMDRAADARLSAHMAEHLLLGDVAPLLIVLWLTRPLLDFYASRNFAPAWTGSHADGATTAAVLATLSHADEQGLQAGDYSATASKWNALPEGGQDAVAFELSPVRRSI